MNSQIGLHALGNLIAAFALSGFCQAQEAKGPNAVLAEGSIWSGMYKHRSNAGVESSGNVEFEITRREGKNIAGQYRVNGGKGVVEFEGTVTGTKVKFRITKVVLAPSDKNLSNIVGLQFNGVVRRDTRSKKTVLAANYDWPSPEDIRVVRHGLLSLTLRE